MLRALPVDVTFVDENDEVRYYSEGERVFPRSPAVIGRKVQNCHPPTSVHKVQQILEAFRAGEKDVAEFWIELSGRFVHIRYFALRDADGHLPRYARGRAGRDARARARGPAPPARLVEEGPAGAGRSLATDRRPRTP